MTKPGNTPYPVDAHFSRQQIQQLTKVPDDVLGYWLRESLLISVPAERRKHRRFNFYQAHIAVVLDAMRRLGANISVLRAFASAMQRGAEITASHSEMSREQLHAAANLAQKLDRFHEGKEVSVFTREFAEWLESNRPKGERYSGDSHHVATTEQDILIGHRTVDPHLDFAPVPKLARALRGEDWRALNMHLDLVNEEFLGDRLPDLNWVWLAWLNEAGQPRILDGEDGNFSIYDSPPMSGFYISISRLIRQLWLPQKEAGE